MSIKYNTSIATPVSKHQTKNVEGAIILTLYGSEWLVSAAAILNPEKEILLYIVYEAQ